MKRLWLFGIAPVVLFGAYGFLRQSQYLGKQPVGSFYGGETTKKNQTGLRPVDSHLENTNQTALRAGTSHRTSTNHTNQTIDIPAGLSHRTGTNDNNATNNSTSRNPAPFFPIRTIFVHENEVDDNSDSEIPPITILVMLSGEFGNNLMKTITGWSYAKIAYEKFGLRSRFVFSEQRRGKSGSVYGKAKKTVKELEKCIPQFKGVDFKMGNRLLDEGYFEEIIAGDSISERLGILRERLKQHPTTHKDETTSLQRAPGTFIIIPRMMIRASKMADWELMDTYYESIKEFLAFDDARCCGETLNVPPLEDETVMHYRNFATEIRKEGRRKRGGFEEMNATEVVSTLLGNLNPLDKIAITGRNFEKESKKNSTKAYNIVRALKERNITVRHSPGSDAMEDFCFLKSAKKEFVGPTKSTFTQMAALMGGPSMKNARLYSYTPEGRSVAIPSYNWSHPELARRIHFEEYTF